MKCQACNRTLKSASGYCHECGSTNEPHKTKKKQRMGKIKWIVSISLIILSIISVSVLYNIGASATSPQHLVSDFKEAVLTEDSMKMVNLLQTNENDWAYTLEDAQSLLNYLSEFPHDRDLLFERLDEQLNVYTEEGQFSPLPANLNYATINLIKSGKKWLLFDEYRLEVTPAYVTVNVNQEQAELYINGEQIQATEEYGPLAPGIYDISAMVFNPNIDVKQDHTLHLFETSNETETIELEISGGHVEVATRYDESIININGEQIRVEAGSTPTEIGFFPLDGSVTLSFEKEFPWGVVRSKEIDVKEEFIQYDEFEAIIDDEKDVIMNILNENWQQKIDTFMTGDFSHMIYASENYLERIEEEYNRMTNRNEEYIATLLAANYVIESLRYPEYNTDTNRYELEVTVEYTVEEPELRRYAVLRKGDLNQTVYDMKMYYSEEKEQWMIDDYDVSYTVIVDSQEQRKFEF